MKKTSIDIAQIVTDKVIEKMEQGIIPWKQTWKSGPVIPINYLTRKQYRGINFLLLYLENNYKTSQWLTFKQVSDLGYSVNKGETATMIIFWNITIKGKYGQKIDIDLYNNMTQTEKNNYTIFPFLRYHNVFNIDQTSIPLELRMNDEIPILECDQIYSNMPNKPALRFESQNAFYNKIEDYINMPEFESFTSAAHYHDTLFHEMIHATGHTSRLNRKELTETEKFNSESYSKEELTAQLGAAMLSSKTGILDQTFDNTVGYLQGWLSRLKNDKNFILLASGLAQIAVDFILNTSFIEGD